MKREGKGSFLFSRERGEELSPLAARAAKEAVAAAGGHAWSETRFLCASGQRPSEKTAIVGRIAERTFHRRERRRPGVLGRRGVTAERDSGNGCIPFWKHRGLRHTSKHRSFSLLHRSLCVAGCVCLQMGPLIHAWDACCVLSSTWRAIVASRARSVSLIVCQTALLWTSCFSGSLSLIGPCDGNRSTEGSFPSAHLA